MCALCVQCCVCVCVRVRGPHHPEEFDHVFPITVVEWSVTAGHLAQRVDVLPGPPPLGCSTINTTMAPQLPHDADLIDDPPHQLQEKRGVEFDITVG